MAVDATSTGLESGVDSTRITDIAIRDTVVSITRPITKTSAVDASSLVVMTGIDTTRITDVTRVNVGNII